MLVQTDTHELRSALTKLADIRNDVHLIEIWLKEWQRESKESLRDYKREIEKLLMFVECKAISTVSYNGSRLCVVG
ncbi:MAG: hypothetical protein PUP91_14845 [Rhizonema sp. PD37]|nr:hypothetical protein [Rhizonema sp. PD37]